MFIPDEPVIYRNIITEDERLQLKHHALDLLQRGELGVNRVTPGNYRNYKSFYKVDDLAPIHKELYNKIVNILNLREPVIDPFLGIIISVIKPSGFIHEHRDQYSEGNGFPQYSHMRNVRFNVIVERGIDESYNPNIDNVSYPVNKCDAWCFNASKIRHKTEKLTGPENRIVYQFGFMMNAN